MVWTGVADLLALFGGGHLLLNSSSLLRGSLHKIADSRQKEEIERSV